MNLIFKGLCPVCNTMIEEDNFSQYSCPKGCYVLYESDMIEVVVPIIDYMIVYVTDGKGTITEIFDSDGGKRILSMNVLFPVNWKNLNETYNKIKKLILFS